MNRILLSVTMFLVFLTSSVFAQPPVSFTEGIKEEQIALLVAQDEARMKEQMNCLSLISYQCYVLKARTPSEMVRRETQLKKWEEKTLLNIEGQVLRIEKIRRAQVECYWAAKKLQPLFSDVQKMATPKSWR